MIVYDVFKVAVRHGHMHEGGQAAYEVRPTVQDEAHFTFERAAEDGEVLLGEWDLSLQQSDNMPIMADSDRISAEKSAYINLGGNDFTHEGNILAIYQHKEWWMRPQWCPDWNEIPYATQMLIWRSGKQKWHVLVANTNNGIRADFESKGESGCAESGVTCVLSMNREHVSEKAVVFAYAEGDSVHECVQKCTRVLAHINGISTCDERARPQILSGFGWCTWDSLGKNVNEDSIFAKMDEFAQKNLKIDWVLIDDGWSLVDRRKEQLLSFKEDCERFPLGLAHTVDILKTKYGVQNVGVWQCFHGYWGGIAENADEEVMCFSEMTPAGVRVPSHTYAGAYDFWSTWHAYLKEQGVDFVKVDSQGSISLLEHGVLSYDESTRNRHTALDDSVKEYFNNGLINCMGMTPENLWNRPASLIVRSSDDYLPHDTTWTKEHLEQNAYVSMLMSGIYTSDWDMFWTDHPHAMVHGVARLMSGGPVYCSDALGRTDAGVLNGLRIFSETLLQRADASRVSEECILNPERALVLESISVGIEDEWYKITAVFGTLIDEDGHSGGVQKVRIKVYGEKKEIYEWNFDTNQLIPYESNVASVNGGQVRVFYSKL